MARAHEILNVSERGVRGELGIDPIIVLTQLIVFASIRIVALSVVKSRVEVFRPGVTVLVERQYWILASVA